MAQLKAKAFLVFLPNGKAVEIRADQADVEQDRETGLIRAIHERRPDGSMRRYEGFPVVIETEAPGLVEPVKTMPPRLVRGD